MSTATAVSSQESFAELFEESLSRQEMRAGEVITAEVVRIDQNFVIVNAGLKSESYIPIDEFRNDRGDVEVNSGDYVQVAIDALEDGYGETRLSRDKAKRIAAWNDILPGIKAMKDLMTTEDGQAWLVPFDWGNTVVTYMTEKVKPEEVQSLKAFADPAFEGRVSIGDNVDDAYALASLALGITDWSTMSDEQFAQASDFLRQVHKNVRLYWTDNTELSQAMAGGEVDLAWAWNETAVTLQADGVPVAIKKDTDEGLSTWVCGYTLLADAPGSEDKAYDYLNAILEPRVSSYIVSEWGYGHSNAKGMEAIDQETLDSTGYGDVQAFVDKTLFQSPVPSELKQKMIAEFEKIKAGY